MKLIPLRCTRCGANIITYDPNTRVVRCTALGCGGSFLLSEGLAFAKVSESAAAAIGHRRRALNRLIEAGDYAGAAVAAREVLSILPRDQDFLAQFYYHYAVKLSGGDPRPYEAFLRETHDAPPEDLDEAFERMLYGLQTREEAPIARFIDLNTPLANARAARMERLAVCARRAEAAMEQYSQVPRDIFLCYHTDSEAEIADMAAARMEAEGWTVWHARRNLPPHAQNYWELVEYAIAHCKVFAVFASKQAMLSQNVQREMRMAQEYACRRVEWKLDKQAHNLAFKYFFDGIQWVPGYGKTAAELEHLLLRVHEELRRDETKAYQSGAKPKESATETEEASVYAQADKNEAERYRECAIRGDANAQYNLGWMYAHGRGVPKDDKQAVHWYRQAANQGHAYAQYNLGIMYARGRGVPKSDEMAVECFMSAAKQGDESAEYCLGMAYEQGRGAEKSDEIAFKWYRSAAQKGLAEAQDSLGVMYEKGRGVRKSDEKAVKWFTSAAMQGHANGQFNLGVMYDTGRGVEQIDDTAARWFMCAAKQGHAGAQYNLAIKYKDGKGVKQSDAEALKWYTLAAEQGHANAQYNLAIMYMRGVGAERSDERAIYWLTQLARQGDADAAGILHKNYGVSV